MLTASHSPSQITVATHHIVSIKIEVWYFMIHVKIIKLILILCNFQIIQQLYNLYSLVSAIHKSTLIIFLSAGSYQTLYTHLILVIILCSDNAVQINVLTFSFKCHDINYLIYVNCFLLIHTSSSRSVYFNFCTWS